MMKASMGPKIDETKGMGTILLIEDEEMVVEVCCALLERLGYYAIVAETGNAAIDIIQAYDGSIDLALLDIVLPDMEARDIYPRIMAARPYLKVLVCSGYAINGPAQDLLDAGAEGFLQKPYSLASLSEKLDEILIGRKTA